MAGQVEDAKARERAIGLGHGFFAGLAVCAGASISSSSSLTLGGGRSSIANALVSSVGGTSIRTSLCGPVRFPPRTRIVSKESALVHRTPRTAGFACPSSSTGTIARPSLSKRVTFLSPIVCQRRIRRSLIFAQVEMICKAELFSKHRRRRSVVRGESITGRDARATGILVTSARLAAGVTPAPGVYTERNAAAAFRGALFWEPGNLSKVFALVQ